MTAQAELARMPSVSECERGRGGWAKEIWLQEPPDDGGQSGEATTVDALAARVTVTANATSLGYGRAPAPASLDSRSPSGIQYSPAHIVQEYREHTLNKRSIKATREMCSYGWHIDRYGLRLAGPQYALSIDPRSLSKADSEYSLNKRAVSAGK